MRFYAVRIKGMMTMAKHWWDWQMEGFDYDEWDELAQDEYRAYLDLKREERHDKNLGLED